MEEEVTIRLGGMEDVLEASNLWLDMVHELHPEYKPRVDWWIKLTANMIAARIGYVMVLAVTKEGKIVGISDAAANPESATGKVVLLGRHLYVAPGYRDGRLYREIYNRTVEEGKKMGVDELQIYCTDDLKSFYKRQGYEESFVIYRKKV